MNTRAKPNTLSIQEVVDLLKQYSITPTQQRIEIAQMLFARPQHLPAEKVLAMVNQDHAAASKATVYNTLNLFARKGLIREVIVDPTKIFYDSTPHQHHHFYNVDTGELTDVPPGTLEVGHLPALPEGTTAVGVDVVVRISSVQRSGG